MYWSRCYARRFLRGMVAWWPLRGHAAVYMVSLILVARFCLVVNTVLLVCFSTIGNCEYSFFLESRNLMLWCMVS